MQNLSIMSRGPRFIISLSLLLILSLFATAPVKADDTHYQDFLVGGRALGLGGAYVSLSDDPSGVYFNPAGLADVRQSSLQVSTSLYGFERGEINPDSFSTAGPGIANLDLDFSQLIVIPASAGFVKTFGEKMPRFTQTSVWFGSDDSVISKDGYFQSGSEFGRILERSLLSPY